MARPRILDGDPALRAQVDQMLRAGFSPDQISSMIKHASGGKQTLSSRAISNHAARRKSGDEPPEPRDPKLEALAAQADAAINSPEIAGDAISRMRARRGQVEAVIKNLGAALTAGDSSTILNFQRLTQIEQKLNEAIAVLEPRPDVEFERYQLLGEEARQELLVRVKVILGET